MRIYDSRLGKFLSVDPLTKSYPHYSPYQFAGNNPIHNTDLDGLEEWGERQFERDYQDIVTNRITIKQLEERVKARHATGKPGLIAIGAAVATVYTGGRALPYIRQLIIGGIVWGSRPENQQRVAEVVNFTAELFNPDPAPLNPGNPGSQIANDAKVAAKYVTKKLFNSVKPILQGRN